MITHAELLDLVSYDPITGIFTLLKPSGRRPAGTPINNNYIKKQSGHRPPRRETSVSLGKAYIASRLAWFYMTGCWPKAEIDHWDTDGWNQKWGNLREASRSQNQANTRLYKSNTSGMKCVFRTGRKARPWRATIQKDKKRISLGRFETKEEAHAAYMAAAFLYHGDFARAA